MAISVGSVSVSVVPSAEGFVAKLRSQLTGVSAVGDEIGRQIGQKITSQISDSVTRGVLEGGAKAKAASSAAGESSGGAFANAFKARVETALRNLPEPKVGLDATELDAELADVRARLSALGGVRVGVDLSTEQALAEMETLKARLAALSARSPDIAVKVDAAAAEAELAKVSAEVTALSKKKAEVDVDKSKVDEAERSVGLLSTAIIGLGPAAVPIGAAIVGGLGASVSVLGALGAGFATVALGAKGVANAVSDQVEPAFEKLKASAASGLLPGVEASIRNILPLMPRIDGFFHGLGQTIGNLATQASAALGGSYWQRFFSFIQSNAGPMLQTFGRIVGNVAHGFAGLIEAFQPVVNQIGAGLQRLTARFAAFGAGAAHNAGFQSFIAYIQSVGPQVVHTIESIVAALAHVVSAIAPLGPPVLAVIRGIADAIRAIPTSALTVLAAGFVAVKVAMFAWSVAPINAVKGAVSLATLALANGATKAEAFGVALTGVGAPAVAALAGVGVLVGVLVHKWEQARAAAAAAKAAIQSTVEGFLQGLNPNALASYQTALAGVVRAQAQVRSQIASDLAFVNRTGIGDSAQGKAITGLQDKLTALDGAYKVIAAQQQHVASNTDALSRVLGVSRSAVVTLANAAGVQLTGSLSQLIGPLQAAQKEAELSHQPTREAAAAFKTMGDSAASASDQLTALDTAWNDLVGNFVGKKTAIADAKAAIADLGKTLKANSSDFRTGTKTGQADWDKLNSTLGSTKDAIDAIFKANGRWTSSGIKAAKSVTDALTSQLPKGSKVAKQVTDDINRYMQHLANQAPAAGKKTGQGLGNGIQSGTKPGAAAIDGLGKKLTAVGQVHAKPTVTVNTSNAMAQLGRVLSFLQNIASHVWTAVVTTVHNFITHGSPSGNKDGGLIGKFAPGGKVRGPGGPRDDMIPALLSNGEFVVNAAAAKKHLGLLEAINAQHFAGGGLAGRGADLTKAFRDAMRIVFQAIAAAVAPDFGTRLSSLFTGGVTKGATGQFSDLAKQVLGGETRRAIELQKQLPGLKKNYQELAQAAKDAAHEANQLAKAQNQDKAAAEKHAQALSDAASKAHQLAANMNGTGKAAAAAKAQAEKHARALDQEARKAREVADSISKSNQKQADSAQKAADAAQKAADKAKAAFDKEKQAAQAAAQKAAESAQAMVQSLQTQADAMLQQVNDFMSTVSQGITGDFSLQSIWQSLVGTDDQGNPVNPTLDQVQKSLDQILANAKQFAADLSKLLAEGAGQDLITQLTQMGSTAGDELAKQLLAAGPGAIKALQTTLAGINSVATNEAEVLGKAFFGAGAEMMLKLLEGLVKAFPELKKALGPIINELADMFGDAGTSGGQKLGSGLLRGLYSSMAGAVPVTGSGAAQPRYGGYGPVTQAPFNSIPIPKFAAGVTNFAGGVALVGENGPEIVYLAPHSSVMPMSAHSPSFTGAGGIATFEGDLYLDSGEWLGQVRGEAHSVVDERVRRGEERARRGVTGGTLTHLKR